MDMESFQTALVTKSKTSQEWKENVGETQVRLGYSVRMYCMKMLLV